MALLDEKIAEIQEWLGTGTLNFFGKPFAGKDTQAAKLATHMGVAVLGGGDILRNSQIPTNVRQSMERGELIPSERYREIVMPYLGQTAFAGKPLLLSSVGRVKGEEVGVLAATKAAGHITKAVPYLDITEEEAFRRLENMSDRGRADDNPDSLRVRFDEFYAKTEPVLAAYEKMGLLIPIDSMAEREVAFHAMVHQIHEYAQSA